MSPQGRRRSTFLGRRARLVVLGLVLVIGAITTYRVVRLARDSTDQNTHWRRHDEAKLLFEAGQFADAAALYEKILGARPADRTARFNLGLCRLRLEDGRGWADVEAVAADDPNFDEAHQMLAERALAAGDTGTAARELALVVDTAPAPARVRVALGDLLLGLGRRAEAMTQMEELARDLEAPAHLRAGAALDLARQYGRRRAFHRAPSGEMRREQEWYGTALRLADDALAVPDVEGRAELLAVRPFALLALDKRGEALAAVEMALREAATAGSRANLQVLRAQMYWMAGDSDAAEQELATAIEGEAPPASVFSAVADVFEARGFRQRALELLAKGYSLHPDDARLRAGYARALFLAGHPDAAEETLRAGAEWPETVDEMVLLADLRRARGDLAGARRLYQRVLELDPRRVDVDLRLRSSATELSVERAGAAPAGAADLEAQARAVLESDPSSPQAQLALARALLLRSADAPELLDEARALLEEAIDADPLLFEAHVSLAVANLRAGIYEDAVVGLERIIAALPTERPELRMLLSEAYIGLGSARRALEEAQRAAEMLGDDPLAFRTVVRAARMERRADIALDALARLQALEPGDVSHVIAQAFVHAEAGDTLAAESRFDAAEAVAERQGDAEVQRAALRQVAEARALAYSRRGDRAAARGALASLVDRLPSDLDSRVRYGRFLQATGDRAEAERVFQAAIGLAPDAMAPRRALADLWFARNEVTPELAALVSRMRVLGGDDPDVLAAEGKLAALQGDLRLARERLQACVAAAPGDADAAFALGVVHARAGAVEEAVATLEVAHRLVPEDPLVREALARARFARARDLARYGRVREARALLEQTVAADPGAAAPRAALADMLRLSGDIALSEAQVREMIRRDPDDALARRILAAMLAQRGEIEEATHELLAAAEKHADDWTVWAALSAAYLELGDVRRAEDIAGRARDAAPDEPGSLSPLLQVLVDSGRSADAVSLVEGARERHPEEARYHVLRAMLHTRAQEHRETVAACRKALALRPATREAVELAAWALRVGLGDPAGALTFVEESLANAPESDEVRYLLGALRSQLGDSPGAMAAFLPLTEGEPPHFMALTMVAMIHMEQRDTAKAREAAERGLAKNPEDANLHYVVAQSWVLDAIADGDPEVTGSRRAVVIERLRKVLELSPDHHTARNNLAYVLSFDESTLPEALELAQQAVAAAPGHAPYADTLGTILVRLGRNDEALATFRSALAVIDRAQAELTAQASQPAAAAEPGRFQRLRLRLERQRADVQRHYEEALGD